MQIISKKSKSKLFNYGLTLSIGFVVNHVVNRGYVHADTNTCTDALDYAHANFQDMRKIALDYQARLACYESIVDGLGNTVICKNGGAS